MVVFLIAVFIFIGAAGMRLLLKAAGEKDKRHYTEFGAEDSSLITTRIDIAAAAIHTMPGCLLIRRGLFTLKLRLSKAQGGFTLVEAVTSMLLAVIIMLSAASFIIEGTTLQGALSKSRGLSCWPTRCKSSGCFKICRRNQGY